MLNKKRIFGTFILLSFIFLNFIIYTKPAKAASLSPSFTLTTLTAGQSANFYAEYTTVTEVPAGGKITVAFRDYSYLYGSTHVGSAITFTDIDVSVDGNNLTLTADNVSFYNSLGVAVAAITTASIIPSGSLIKFYIGRNATGGNSNAQVTVASNINVIAETLTSGGMSLDIGNSDAVLASTSTPEFSTYVYIITILGGLLMIYKKSNLQHRSNSNIAI